MNFLYLCTGFVPQPLCSILQMEGTKGYGLKGNQVKVLNSPAAVSRFYQPNKMSLGDAWEDVWLRVVSQKTCKTHHC